MSASIDVSARQKLLLATDLSARCDRPLERGKQLAGEWQAQLVMTESAMAMRDAQLRARRRQAR